MRYRHNTWTSDEGAVGVLADVKQRVRSRRNKAVVLRRRLELEGEVTGSTQAAIRTAMNNVTRAFLVDGPSSGLLHDDGSQSVHYLPSAGSLTGVKVARPPSFTNSDPAQYATYRSFTFAVEADYPVLGADELLDFQETISFRGNCGPRTVDIELDTGRAVQQVVSERTVQTITQTGSAIGLYDYPLGIVPAPIYPKLLKNPDEGRAFTSPINQGARFTRWPVRWNYTMTSSRPLSGRPNRR